MREKLDNARVIKMTKKIRDLFFSLLPAATSTRSSSQSAVTYRMIARIVKKTMLKARPCETATGRWLSHHAEGGSGPP
jgi:hypothetical protein